MVFSEQQRDNQTSVMPLSHPNELSTPETIVTSNGAKYSVGGLNILYTVEVKRPIKLTEGARHFQPHPLAPSTSPLLVTFYLTPCPHSEHINASPLPTLFSFLEQRRRK